MLNSDPHQITTHLVSVGLGLGMGLELGLGNHVTISTRGSGGGEFGKGLKIGTTPNITSLLCSSAGTELDS